MPRQSKETGSYSHNSKKKRRFDTTLTELATRIQQNANPLSTNAQLEKYVHVKGRHQKNNADCLVQDTSHVDIKQTLPLGVEVFEDCITNKDITHFLSNVAYLQYYHIDNLTDTSNGRQQTRALQSRSRNFGGKVRLAVKNVIQRFFQNTGYPPVQYDTRILRTVVDEQMRAPGDQGHHVDYTQSMYGSFYSVIIALQRNTFVCFCLGDQVVRVHVPIGGMVRWTGNVCHGGAKYIEDNYRIFFKVIEANTVIRNTIRFEIDRRCGHRGRLRPDIHHGGNQD